MHVAVPLEYVWAMLLTRWHRRRSNLPPHPGAVVCLKKWATKQRQKKRKRKKKKKKKKKKNTKTATAVC